MLELYELYVSIKDKPITWTTIIGIAIFVIDKLQKRFIANYLRKLFNLANTSEVKQYVENQRRIESKIDLLLKEQNLQWDARNLTNGLSHGVRKNNPLSALFAMAFMLVKRAAAYIRYRGERMKLNKAILIPLLSAIALFVKQAFGYEFPSEYINIGSDIILFVVTVLGTFIQPKKEGTKKDGISDTFERTE